MSSDKIGLFKKYTWLKWIFIVPLASAALYFVVNLLPEDFEKSSMFTQYGELKKDTIQAIIPDTTAEVVVDTSLVNGDTLPLKNTSAILPKLDSTKQGKEGSDSGEATVAIAIDESYKFGADEQKNNSDSLFTNSNNYHPISIKSTIFNELLLANNPIDTSQIAYKNFFTKNIVTSKTILKIVATVGKNVLINGNTEDAKDIFESIVEEAQIIGILLADRTGKIIYSSNAKFLHGTIDSVFPAINTNQHSIGWGNNEHQLVTSLAIHHTYGQIGNVVLVTQQ